ncbi:hypothetical protein TWF718_009274 [Orbilia javanica]|uniref:Uncharacterized protein n=1 Tax=Orbilia javanica TaxID=47235 RepID=A0AAN8MP74_9PEZI
MSNNDDEIHDPLRWEHDPNQPFPQYDPQLQYYGIQENQEGYYGGFGLQGYYPQAQQEHPHSNQPEPSPQAQMPQPAETASGSSSRGPTRQYCQEENNFLIWAAGERRIRKENNMTDKAMWEHITNTMRAWLWYKHPRLAATHPERNYRTLKEHWSRGRGNNGCLKSSWEEGLERPERNPWGTEALQQERDEITQWYLERSSS